MQGGEAGKRAAGDGHRDPLGAQGAATRQPVSGGARTTESRKVGIRQPLCCRTPQGQDFTFAE